MFAKKRDVVLFFIDSATDGVFEKRKEDGLTFWDIQKSVYSIQNNLKERLKFDLGYSFRSQFKSDFYSKDLLDDLEAWLFVGALASYRKEKFEENFMISSLGRDYVRGHYEGAIKNLERGLGKEGFEYLKNITENILTTGNTLAKF